MAKVKQIYIDIYKRSIFIFVGNHNQFINWITEEFKNDSDYEALIDYVHEVDKGNTQASFWYNGAIGEGIIEIPKFPRTPKEIAYCTHECLHAVFHVLNYCGVEYDKESSGEAHTYLLEYFVRELLKFDDYKNV